MPGRTYLLLKSVSSSRTEKFLLDEVTTYQEHLSGAYKEDSIAPTNLHGLSTHMSECPVLVKQSNTVNIPVILNFHRGLQPEKPRNSFSSGLDDVFR